MAFDRQAAKAAGYTDEEIAAFLAENPQVAAPAETPAPAPMGDEPPPPGPVEGYQAPGERGMFPEFVRPHVNPSVETAAILGTAAATGAVAAAKPYAVYKGLQRGLPVAAEKVAGAIAPRPVAPPPAPAPAPRPSPILDASGRPMQRAAQTAAEPAAMQAANAFVRNEALQRILRSGGEALGAVGKYAAKKVPVAGAAFGAYDAANRLQQGDKLGAGIATAAAGASMVPVIGTAASIGLDAINLGRDYFNYQEEQERKRRAGGR